MKLTVSRHGPAQLLQQRKRVPASEKYMQFVTLAYFTTCAPVPVYKSELNHKLDPLGEMIREF